MKNHTRPRHAVIDQDGRTVEDTQRFPRLHAVAELVRHHAEPEAPVSHLLHDGRNSVVRTLPVHGAATIVLRRPVAPTEPIAAVNPFPPSFFEDPRFVAELNSMRSRVHEETHRMFLQFGDRMDGLLRRARGLSARWRQAAADGAGRDLAAAYAEFGTGTIPAVTGEIVAQMVERAKAGAGVAA